MSDFIYKDGNLTIKFCESDKEWAEYHTLRRTKIIEPTGLVYDPNHPSLTDPNNYHMVLYNKAEIVSAAQLEFLSDKESALRILATFENEQGKGYGAFFLKNIEKWLKEKNISVVKLHSDKKAVKFYKRHGYSEIEFDDVSIDPESVDLGKTL